MLIYLDANIVQYCADYGDFIFGNTARFPVRSPKFRKELMALRTLVELEQLSDGWVVAAPHHLLAELHRGRPTRVQRETYQILRESWQDSGEQDEFLFNDDDVVDAEQHLVSLNLRDFADRRHLAEAITMQAAWFLTNDGDIINKIREEPMNSYHQNANRRRVINRSTDIPFRLYRRLHQGLLLPYVARPSECLDEISVGLFLK